MTAPAQSFPLARRVWRVLLLCALVLGAVAAWRYARIDEAPAGASQAPPRAAPPARLAANLPDENAAVRAALGGALKLAAPGVRLPEFGRLLRAWIVRDPEAALAYVRQLPRGAEFSAGLALVLDAISRRDVDRALQLAGELAATREDRAFYSALFARLAHEDLAGAVGKLALILPGEGRANALRALTDVWASRAASDAVAWARQLPDAADRAVALESALFTLTSTDPLQAVELALANLDGLARSRVVSSGLRALNATDPTAAASLVALLPPGELQTQAAIDVARALAGHNPSAAIRWLESLPEGGTRRVALNNILDVWTAADAASAGNYVAHLETGSAQDAAASHYAALLASANPSAAVAWIQTLASDSARDAALVSVASSWARRDPAAATQWAGLLPPGAAQRTALNGALSFWLLDSPTAAREFVRTLPAAAQVGAARFVAPLLAQSDPSATLNWAASLPVPAARDAALAAAYTRWLDNAPTAARDWLAHANLSADLKARLQGLPSP